MNKILTICIPTYNRKEVLINEVNEYLSVNDDRFLVKVSDNCSTDGTQEALNTINDPRLIINYNRENLGSIPNWIKALSDNESEYLIFTLDKDLVDINQLKYFLDFLEHEKPCFGYADLDLSKPKGYEKTEPGFDNVLKTAYLDKHPSGYFYRRDLFEEAIMRDSFLKIDKRFDFPFEVINAELAVEYPSIIVRGGLVINANYRNELKGNKTLSYDDSNIWFGTTRRLMEYGYYIDNALNLTLNPIDKYSLAKKLTEKGIINVSILLRQFLRDESVCLHYNVKIRHVGFLEMFHNIKQVLKQFSLSSVHILNKKQRICVKTQGILKFLVFYIRSLFRQ